ncbi:MAG: RsmB/NOP family class I SAM-dependent RNA methyltransferase [Candidatus Gracilibacteria bacterium]|nr:RsmB/NOP family class I SAM-dependent RNA methyltransferase [Candidatus Gracilibacteria bacterium]
MQNLPKIFTQKLEKIFSKEELEIIYSGYSLKKRQVSFRVNTLKSSNEEIESILHKENIKFQKISYLTNGYKLIDGLEKDLWNLDIFTEGKIYLQGITSQFIGEIVQKDFKNQDLKILDLTASPGGKTSHISAIMQNYGEIIANELNTIRIEKLNFTINRQGCTNIKVIHGDARNLKNLFPNGYFDLIIADLPCSAEGRINLNNEKSYLFLQKPGINEKNYKIQKDILKNTVDLLKIGGSLIYSTCTIDPRENEAIIHFLLSNYKDLVIEEINDIFENENIKKYIKKGIKSFDKYIYNSQVSKTIRIIPSQETEGFFIAKIKKLENL